MVAKNEQNGMPDDLPEDFVDELLKEIPDDVLKALPDLPVELADELLEKLPDYVLKDLPDLPNEFPSDAEEFGRILAGPLFGFFRKPEFTEAEWKAATEKLNLTPSTMQLIKCIMQSMSFREVAEELDLPIEAAIARVWWLYHSKDLQDRCELISYMAMAFIRIKHEEGLEDF